MNKLIRKFSPTVELLIVLLIAFGLFIYTSTSHFFVINSDNTHSWIYNLTNQGNYFIVIYEIIAFLIIAYILKVRNWKLSDFNLKFAFKLIFIALLLMFIRNIIANVSYKILEITNIVEETSKKQVEYSLSANWISISLIIIINSIFEEFILIGYLFKRLEKFHPAIIIGLSLIIRELYHTYQGWISLILIIPTGLVFGIYYYKYKKLWPIIIAHGLSNLIAFLSMHFHWYEKFQSLRGQ